MTEPTFTPGPWCVEDPMGDGPGDSLWIVSQVEGGKVYNWRCIALVSDDTDAKSDQPPIYVRQRDANARLIAAAPKLYTALETFEQQWNACGPNSDFGRHFQSIRDAAVDALAEANADHWLNKSRAALAKVKP